MVEKSAKRNHLFCEDDDDGDEEEEDDEEEEVNENNEEVLNSTWWSRVASMGRFFFSLVVLVCRLRSSLSPVASVARYLI